jgi:hypothetical protein
METQPLTSQHLQSSSFGKVDKPCFIDAYIQAQRVHAGAYAVQGRVLSSLWDCAPNKDQPDVPKQPQDCGFETPELRPRTIRPQNDLADQIQTGISISEKHEERRRPPEQPTTMAPRHTHKKATTRDGHLAHATDTTRKIVSTVDVQGKRSSGKHPIIIDSDEEHAARKFSLYHWCRYRR